MNNLFKYILPVLCACLTALGCGSSSSSTVPAPGSNTNVLNGVTLTGSQQGKSAGLADVDGDGTPDKVVGAPYTTTTTSTNTGAVLVYKGDSTGGFSSTPSSLLTGDDVFGASFVKLEKSSSDTAERFAVAALYGDGDDVSLSGSVSIYQGGSGGAQLIKKLAGEGPLDRFGFSLAAGDLDGDGYNDLIVGAQYNTPSSSLYQQGAVYVYFGPEFTRSIPLRATSANKGLGWAVATGDINSDGKADLLIAASKKVLVYHGGTSFDSGSSTPVSLDSPDATIKNSASDFGKVMAVIGDVNGDGIIEIAIGAPKAKVNSNRDTGAVYIVSGTVAGTVDLEATTPPADLIVQINGVALFDRFRSSIVPVGDVDADGKADFAVSAPLADVNTNDLSGKVYLFKGMDISAST
ncbi:MAG: FG-GAP repeat protein, partial [Deltaproteobacteria bacterium]|nr:FG-GAP repeat protein [Deltaproteobacteria bacterium]